MLKEKLSVKQRNNNDDMEVNKLIMLWLKEAHKPGE